MPDTLFISDLHLAPSRSATVECFLGFLGQRARQARALYILGDLFDVWVGDDDDHPPYPEVRAALRRLTEPGTDCYLMHGNRDFLIGRSFARDTGCRLFPDPTAVELAGVPTLLMHGDLLCTDDVPYQKFRRCVRNPVVKHLFLWMPLTKRRAIAADYRRKSGVAMDQALGRKTPHVFLDRPLVHIHDRRRFLRHGHTHRPADHSFALDGNPVTRLVLAEWQADRGEVLVVSEDGWEREAIRSG